MKKYLVQLQFKLQLSIKALRQLSLSQVWRETKEWYTPQMSWALVILSPAIIPYAFLLLCTKQYHQRRANLLVEKAIKVMHDMLWTIALHKMSGASGADENY